MLLNSLNRGIASVLFLVLCIVGCFAQGATTGANSGMQIEFPAGGRLRIENQFGSVAVESWKEKFIHITTSEDTVASKARSVVIENGKLGTVIRVMRRPRSRLLRLISR